MRPSSGVRIQTGRAPLFGESFRVFLVGIKKGLCLLAEPLFVLVAGVGFEPTTFRL